VNCIKHSALIIILIYLLKSTKVFVGVATVGYG